MTTGIILTHVTVTATSLYHCYVARWQLDTWQFFFYFLKKFKKNSKKKFKTK